MMNNLDPFGEKDRNIKEKMCKTFYNLFNVKEKSL